jgi:hypothetical protein
MSSSLGVRLRCALCVGIAIIVLTACDDGGATTTPVGGGDVVVSSGDARACNRTERVVTSARNRKQGALRGDVDGDGARDEVFVVVAQRARRGCRAFVVADTGDRLLAAPIEGDFVSFDLGLPALKSLAAINLDAGSEIVVDVAAGASEQFASVFTVAEGVLVPVSISGAINRVLVAYGGSVGHVAAIDCESEGRIVISSAVPSGDRYRVMRRFASARGRVWRADPDATERALVSFRGLRDYHEFVRPPFGSCPIR